MSRYIDVIVPRGGRGLVSKVQKYSKIHVIGHLEGNCHIYLDNKSSLKMAKKVILNAKMRRTRYGDGNFIKKKRYFNIRVQSLIIC